MALYPTKIFISDIPYDDVYIIYFFVPGVHIWLIAGQISNLCFSLASNKDVTLCSIGSLHVFIPGVIGIIVGGLQWHIIGKIILLFRGKN
jgi:hypothetical protein